MSEADAGQAVVASRAIGLIGSGQEPDPGGLRRFDTWAGIPAAGHRCRPLGDLPAVGSPRTAARERHRLILRR
jgi:hypothetical protein